MTKLTTAFSFFLGGFGLLPRGSQVREAQSSHLGIILQRQLDLILTHMQSNFARSIASSRFEGDDACIHQLRRRGAMPRIRGAARPHSVPARCLSAVTTLVAPVEG